MEEAIKQLSATGRILSKLHGRPVHEKVSLQERKKLEATLETCSLTSETCAVLLDAVCESNFAPDDAASLIELLGQKMCNPTSSSSSTTTSPPLLPAGPATRGAMQQWEQLPKYLPSTVWDKLAAGDMTYFLDHLCRMGLRRPTEPTCVVMALLCLLQTDGEERVRQMSADEKLSFINAIKKSFKERAKLMPSPCMDVSVLPASPTEFRSMCPGLWKAAFSDEEPSTSRVSEVALAAFRGETKMRRTKSASILQLQQPADGFMQLGQGLLAQMQSIALAMSQLQRPQGLQNLQILQRPGVLPQMQISQPPQPPAPPVLALEAPPLQENIETVQPHPSLAKTRGTKRSVDDITREIQAELAKNNDCKDVSRSTKKSTAKKKAASKAASKASKTKSTGHGCSKCRYSEKGCARCRGA
jgi:hypothetical protein